MSYVSGTYFELSYIQGEHKTSGDFEVAISYNKLAAPKLLVDVPSPASEAQSRADAGNQEKHSWRVEKFKNKVPKLERDATPAS